ncbi:hypothetical protein [Rivularia sp. UHCC 0363]|uniref:hypothetical protein n=1 Tax=Rivularia sp. UHCC 0363 TaxID=3110244 RepID=UPI002B1F2BC5|nr:hypothetical protein [Rivularia sp. UHCC 0363]MEA5593349.1 hypothetical protein [Rivularia sp. UHCC 0363]
MKKLAVVSIAIASPLLWLVNNQVSAAPKQTISPSISQAAKPPQDKWRRMNQQEEINQIKSLIDSRMGVAALNQLALEGFIGFGCKRSFYVNEPYGGFQTLMRVKCNQPKGASSAIGYDEIRVVFNRFESNIEDFKIERVSQETGSPKIKLPD